MYFISLPIGEWLNWFYFPLITWRLQPASVVSVFVPFLSQKGLINFRLTKSSWKIAVAWKWKGIPVKQITLPKMLLHSVKYGLSIKVNTFGQERLLKHHVLHPHVLNPRLPPQKAWDVDLFNMVRMNYLTQNIFGQIQQELLLFLELEVGFRGKSLKPKPLFHPKHPVAAVIVPPKILLGLILIHI